MAFLFRRAGRYGSGVQAAILRACSLAVALSTMLGTTGLVGLADGGSVGLGHDIHAGESGVSAEQRQARSKYRARFRSLVADYLATPPVQANADQNHGRQRQKDIRSKGDADTGQEITAGRHHSTKNRYADGDRDPLARDY